MSCRTGSTMRSAWGRPRPTAARRIVFVQSREAKEKLQPALAEGNRAKSMAAPVTAIIGYDLHFYEKMGKLFPHVQGVRNWFDKDERTVFIAAFRNGTLQPDRGVACPRPRLRSDVKLRQRDGGPAFLCWHRSEVELSLQPRLWRPSWSLSAQPATGIQQGLQHCLKPLFRPASVPAVYLNQAV